MPLAAQRKIKAHKEAIGGFRKRDQLHRQAVDAYGCQMAAMPQAKLGAQLANRCHAVLHRANNQPAASGEQWQERQGEQQAGFPQGFAAMLQVIDDLQEQEPVGGSLGIDPRAIEIGKADLERDRQGRCRCRVRGHENGPAGQP